ncbi:MAG TPA: PHP domain-containing protein [Vicinamibacterales bacterium]|nr:PHP domain-containing protein [Vicinamibacterales bacterium]
MTVPSLGGLVDLHLHTTASDGRCSPRELVDRVAAAGVAVMGVTDHDTLAAVREVQALAAPRGIEVVPGIEITAIEDGRDVHVLGYFLDVDDPGLDAFLRGQRAARVSRVRAIGARLAELGMPVDIEPLVAHAEQHGGESIGRPRVARLMIEAGYVADSREAFDRWLAFGQPAFMPRTGPSPEEVIGVIHRAGGLASLAHPGLTKIDARIDALQRAGLDALEVFHSEHDGNAVERYGRMARELSLLVTGGSDFHGDPAHGPEPGAAVLPGEEWARLRAAAGHGR